MRATANIAASGVSGLVLAGGQGRRMGGVDKGLQPFCGRPLVEAVMERLRPQVSELLLNVAPAASAYARYGLRLVFDEFHAPDGSLGGPLAGLHAGMAACTEPLIATAPCDAPHLPSDLVSRLRQALENAGADVAVVRTGAFLQPVFALVRRELRPVLAAFLEHGGRKIDGWYETLNSVQVAFDDQPSAFANLNTIEELRRLEAGRLTELP
jgi:molybdopterin-guanine dinucleotide biosynthesis protein A